MVKKKLSPLWVKTEIHKTLQTLARKDGISLQATTEKAILTSLSRMAALKKARRNQKSVLANAHAVPETTEAAAT